MENGSSGLTDAEPELAKISDPQIRRWRIGSYTLLADSDVLESTWRLECILHLGGYSLFRGEDSDESKCPDAYWQTSWGGHLVYIADGETEEVSLPNSNV